LCLWKLGCCQTLGDRVVAFSKVRCPMGKGELTHSVTEGNIPEERSQSHRFESLKIRYRFLTPHPFRY
jgi:hypothetical protein